MVQRMKASDAIRSARVEAAFLAVLRHTFVPGVGLDLVYSGNSLVTHSDAERGITSSSSEVAIMAPMLEDLALEHGHRVLEIGAGTGYNAALLDELVGPGGEVITIDNQPEVAAEARERLTAAGHGRVRVITGDGHAGYLERAPYDRIIATASVNDVPLSWRDQLRDGGRLCVALRLRPTGQVVVTFLRHHERLESVAVVAGGFMPLRTDQQSLDEPLRIDGQWLVQLTTPQAGDEELLSSALSSEPAIETYDLYPGQALFSLAGLIEPDWVVVRPQQGNGVWQGLLDRSSRGMAFIWPIPLPTRAFRSGILVYGASDARDRLRKILDELAGVAVSRMHLQAVPRSGPRPIADLVSAAPNFYYALEWRAMRPPGTETITGSKT